MFLFPHCCVRLRIIGRSLLEGNSLSPHLSSLHCEKINFKIPSFLLKNCPLRDVSPKGIAKVDKNSGSANFLLRISRNSQQKIIKCVYPDWTSFGYHSCLGSSIGAIMWRIQTFYRYCWRGEYSALCNIEFLRKDCLLFGTYIEIIYGPV